MFRLTNISANELSLLAEVSLYIELIHNGMTSFKKSKNNKQRSPPPPPFFYRNFIQHDVGPDIRQGHGRRHMCQPSCKVSDITKTEACVHILVDE